MECLEELRNTSGIVSRDGGVSVGGLGRQSVKLDREEGKEGGETLLGNGV